MASNLGPVEVQYMPWGRVEYRTGGACETEAMDVGNDHEQLEPSGVEEALQWIAECTAYAMRGWRIDPIIRAKAIAGRAYLIAQCSYADEHQRMMTRDEVLTLIASCMKDRADAWLNAQAYAFAQVLGAHDQHELALYDELMAKAEREAEEA